MQCRGLEGGGGKPSPEVGRSPTGMTGSSRAHGLLPGCSGWCAPRLLPFSLPANLQVGDRFNFKEGSTSSGRVETEEELCSAI